MKFLSLRNFRIKPLNRKMIVPVLLTDLTAAALAILMVHYFQSSSGVPLSGARTFVLSFLIGILIFYFDYNWLFRRREAGSDQVLERRL